MPLLDATNGLPYLNGNEFIEVHRPHETKYATPSQLLSAMSNPPALTGTTPVINWNLGTVFTLLLSGNTTVTFSNAANGREIKVVVTNTTGNFTVTWPTGIKWAGGSAPTQTTGAHTDIVTFRQFGGVIYGSTQQNF